MTDVRTKRPTWATFVASGFLLAGFGAFVLAIGFLFSGGFTVLGIASGVIALGASVSSFGAYGYFISR